MKMAEEVTSSPSNHDDHKAPINNSDITNGVINKCGDEPVARSIETQEDAVEEEEAPEVTETAGDTKDDDDEEEEEEEILVAVAAAVEELEVEEEEEIENETKTTNENEIIIEEEKTTLPSSSNEQETIDDEEQQQQEVTEQKIVEEVVEEEEEEELNEKTNNDESLNKMHVMEDVREGCDTQPSSPGHAEQRVDITTTPPDNSSSTTTTTTFDAKSSISKEHNDSKVDCDDEVSMDSKDEGKEETAALAQSPKRKNDTNDTSATLTKKVRNEYHQQEMLLRNKILSEYTDALDMTNFEQIQQQTEQLLIEIQSLNDLAKEKEKEWNNIIHLKKMKEELLIRIQRQKQVCLLSNGLEISESSDGLLLGGGDERTDNGRQKMLQRRLNNRPLDAVNRHKLAKQLQQHSYELNGQDGKSNKQRPVRDVQSIIADYRQRHPESVPRRGRRIRTVNGGGGGETDKVSSSGIIKFSNMALGSGSQVKHNPNSSDAANDLNLLLSAMEATTNQDPSAASNADINADTASFKDILMQFAKLSQSDRQELLQSTMKPPPPYPEVTVHPVSTSQPTSSLLHGILTKAQNKNDTKSAFSPTLARLLTAPERNIATQQNSQQHNNNKASSNVSISDILSTNKARNEITITPVGNEYEASPKRKNDEEEAEDSVDRLVIDESGEIVDRTDNNSDAGDEVPQCQGCNQKAAQFVCAGCGNQWYCSRECQVSAWDEHSEVCSG